MVRMKPKETEKLEWEVRIAVGMEAMVVINIATKADLANGTHGKVVELVLDPQEPDHCNEARGQICLQLPPAVIFKPSHGTFPQFPGLSEGLLPIFSTKRTFPIHRRDRHRVMVTCQQTALAGVYAFTDYKAQGQTLEYVVVDIAKPPRGSLTPFSPYVALSRSRGRNMIRLLRPFDKTLLTSHPSEALEKEDVQLEEKVINTKKVYPIAVDA